MLDARYSRLIKNACIVFVGNAGNKLLLFLLLPFYTQWLSPEEYGVSDLVITYAMMLIGLVTCQIQDAIFVFPKNEPFERQRSYFSSGLRFLVAAYAVFGIVMAAVGFLLPEGSFFGRYSLQISCYLMLLGVYQYLQQFSRAVDCMICYAAAGLGFAVAVVAFSFLLIPGHPTGSMLVYSQCAGCAAGILIAGVGTKVWRYMGFRYFSRPDLAGLLRYALPLVPTTIMWWTLNSLNRPMLDKYTSLAAVGIYAAAVKFPAVINLMWSVVGNAWQISVLEEYSKSGFVRYFAKIVLALAAAVVLIVALMSVLAPYLMRWFVDKEFFEGYKLIPVLSVGAGFSMLAGAIGAVYAASKQSKYFLYSSIWAISSIVLLNYLLIPKYGLMGAAVANASALAIEFVVRIYYCIPLLRKAGK